MRHQISVLTLKELSTPVLLFDKRNKERKCIYTTEGGRLLDEGSAQRLIDLTHEANGLVIIKGASR